MRFKGFLIAEPAVSRIFTPRITPSFSEMSHSNSMIFCMLSDQQLSEMPATQVPPLGRAGLKNNGLRRLLYAYRRHQDQISLVTCNLAWCSGRRVTWLNSFFLSRVVSHACHRYRIERGSIAGQGCEACQLAADRRRPEVNSAREMKGIIRRAQNRRSLGRARKVRKLKIRPSVRPPLIDGLRK